MTQHRELPWDKHNELVPSPTPAQLADALTKRKRGRGGYRPRFCKWMAKYDDPTVAKLDKLWTKRILKLRRKARIKHAKAVASSIAKWARVTAAQHAEQGVSPSDFVRMPAWMDSAVRIYQAHPRLTPVIQAVALKLIASGKVR